MMNIRRAAAFAGISVKAARYYCDIGLATCGRGENNYRVFSQKDAADMRFVARARAAGFSLEECRRLLALRRDGNRASADVKQLALAHIAKIEKEIGALNDMRARLLQIADDCPGDETSGCPILDALAEDDGTRPAA